MYGVKYLFLCLYLFLAVLEDFRNRKISNWQILFGLGIGFLFLLKEGGRENVADGLIGMCLPFVLLFLLYAFRTLGAGDVKLFMVAGLFLGKSGVLKGMCWAFLFGGILALCKMIKTKGVKTRFQYLGNYVKYMFKTRSMEVYVKGAWKQDMVIHFSLCIWLGCLPVIGGVL